MVMAGLSANQCDRLWLTLPYAIRKKLIEALRKRRSIMVFGDNASIVSAFTSYLFTHYLADVGVYSTATTVKDLRRDLMFDPPCLSMCCWDVTLAKPLESYFQANGFGVYGMFVDDCLVGYEAVALGLLPEVYGEHDKLLKVYEISQKVPFSLHIDSRGIVGVYQHDIHVEVVDILDDYVRNQ